MTYTFYYDAPGSSAVYGLVSSQLGVARPEGLVIHVVTRTGEGLRHLNVWQSREQWEVFRDTQVRPAVAAVLSRLHRPVPEEPPHEYELELVDIGPLPDRAEVASRAQRPHYVGG